MRRRRPERQSAGRRGAVINHRGAPAPSPVVRLPVVGHMAPTVGDRDERCALYGACLSAHVVAHKRSDPPASCPPACRFRELVVERATDHASTGGCYLARADEHRVW